MATVTRLWDPGRNKYVGTRTERTITEIYLVRGFNCHNPAVAQGKPGLPVYGAAHTDIAACKVTRREVVSFAPDACIATINYSDNPDYTMAVDGAAVTTYDMMGRTERQYWDILTNAAIGADNEGYEVYRPYMEITYDHLESSINVGTIMSLTGRTNNGSYKGYAAGTLLFLGARARSEGSNWKVTYHFLVDSDIHRASWRPYTESESGGEVVRTYGAEVFATVYPSGTFSLLPI